MDPLVSRQAKPGRRGCYVSSRNSSLESSGFDSHPGHIFSISGTSASSGVDRLSVFSRILRTCTVPRFDSELRRSSAAAAASPRSGINRSTLREWRGHPEKGMYRAVHPANLLGRTFTELLDRLPPALQNLLAVLGRHARTEAVAPFALQVAGLESALGGHGSRPLVP